MRRITSREWTNEYGLERIREWAEKGLNNEQIFTNIGISQTTFYTWLKEFPILTKTIREARLKYTTELEKALSARAQGENFDDEIKSVLKDVKLDFRSVTFLFMPEEFERFKKAITQAIQYSDLAEDIYVCRLEDFEKLLKTQSIVQAAYNVESIATSLPLMLDIVNRHKDELSAGYIHKNGKLKHKGKVPISSVLDDDKIPAELASKLRIVIRKEIKKGTVQAENKAEILRILLEKYLGGDKNG